MNDRRQSRAQADERELAERLSHKRARELATIAAVALGAGLVFLVLGIGDRDDEAVFDQRGVRARAAVVAIGEGGLPADPRVVAELAPPGGELLRAEFEITDAREAELEPGDELEVIYNPDSPTQARPVDGWSRPSDEKFIFAGTGFVTAMLVGGGAFASRRRAEGIALGEIDLEPPGPEAHRRGSVTATTAPGSGRVSVEGSAETAADAAGSAGVSQVDVPDGTEALRLPHTVRSLPASLGRGLLVAAAVGAGLAYAVVFVFLAVGLLSSRDLFAEVEQGAPGPLLAIAAGLAAVVASSLRIALVLRPGELVVRELGRRRRISWDEVAEVLIAQPMPDRLGGPTVALRLEEETVTPTASGMLDSGRRWALAATLIREAEANGIAVTGTAIVAGIASGRAEPAEHVHVRRPVEAAAPHPEPGAAERSIWWGLRHSLWVLWTLGLGFTSWIAFAYIGLRVRRRAWLVWAAIYGLIAVATAITASLSEDERGLDVAILALLLFGVPVVSLIHALVVRPKYLRARIERERPATERT